MRLLGIDFGTSNTVGMIVAPGGRTQPLLFDGSPVLPSAVYLGTDGRMLVGRDAERSARLDPARFEPNPKRRVDDGAVLLGDVEVPVPRLVGAVLAEVAAEAYRQLGGPPDEVRLTHPERWGERRRAVLRSAAESAGFGAVRLVAEPVAAAAYYTAVLGSALPIGRALAVYDLGGGTFDAAVVRRTPAGFEVLAEAGLTDVGGLDFDYAIVEHLARTHAAADPAWNRLRQPADPADRRDRQLLYDDVRGAKEMLSRTASADIHLPVLRTDAHVTREELEALVRPLLDRTVACLAAALAEARLPADQLAGIFLVGGSSRIPLAAHLIHTALGIAPTTLEQPQTVVAEGALFLDRPVSAPAIGLATSGIPRPIGAPVSPPWAAAGAQPVSGGGYPGRPVSGSPVSGGGYPAAGYAGGPPTGGGRTWPPGHPMGPLSPRPPTGGQIAVAAPAQVDPLRMPTIVVGVLVCVALVVLLVLLTI